MRLPEVLTFVPIAFTALFPVVNPIGSSVLFLNLTSDADRHLRGIVARKIAGNSMIIMSVTLFLGVYILKLFGISIPVVQLCGGLVLFVMGWKSLNAEDEPIDSSRKGVGPDDVDVSRRYANQSFYPFTFPFTVGPGTIAASLTLSAEASSGKSENNWELYVGTLIAMALVSACVWITYAYADRLVDKMGANGRRVIMRLLSFILLCIGGQITVNGITAIIQSFA